MTYRGDSLKNVETLKEAQVKVLQYFKLEKEKKLIDPKKIWLSKKAKLMGLTLKKENLKNLPNASKDFVFDLSNLSLTDGWSKRLDRMPSFCIEHIDTYSQKINTIVLSKSKKWWNVFVKQAAVSGKFYWYCIYLFKTVRYIILLEGIMHCKFKKTELLDFYGIVLKLMAQFHMLTVNALLGK